MGEIGLKRVKESGSPGSDADCCWQGPTPFETMKSRKLAGPEHDEPENMGSRLHGISPLVASQPPPVHPPIPADGTCSSSLRVFFYC